MFHHLSRITGQQEEKRAMPRRREIAGEPYTGPMDVYDFDGTLYKGDSTADFLRFCAGRHPRILTTLPRTALAAFECLGLRWISKTQFKEMLYRFLPKVPDIHREVEAFWASHERKIAGPCRPQPGDVVISAGPEFLLRPMCEKRGLALIASPVDPITGRTLGPNCSNEQKVVRLQAEYPDKPVRRFFSDSHNDDPLAALAQEAFMVKSGRLEPWSFA